MIIRGQLDDHEFWRFVFVQDKVGQLAKSAVEFPPMQRPASFNLEAVKESVKAAVDSHVSQ